MRTSILMMTMAATLVTLAVTLVAAQTEARAKKPDVGAGRVAWFDITTTDLAKSKEFYCKLFD